MKKSNIITGFIFLAISIVGYVIGSGFKSALTTDPLGPAFWPKMVSAAMGVFSIILILQGIITKKENEGPPPFDFKSEGFWRMVKLAAVLIAFLLITYFGGIYIGIMFMIPVTMYLLGERNKKLMIIFTVTAVGFFYIVFKRRRVVPLPEGKFF